jgi:hypothetical protein
MRHRASHQEYNPKITNPSAMAKAAEVSRRPRTAAAATASASSRAVTAGAQRSLHVVDGRHD